jgi:hypothetical protein
MQTETKVVHTDLKICSNGKHIEGGWYKGRQHTRGYDGEPGVVIIYYTDSELYRFYKMSHE